MTTRIPMPFILGLGVAFSVGAQQPTVPPNAAPVHVVPLKKMPAEQRSEKVSGDPKIPGAPFVIRLHREAGYIIMPHAHRVDENIVVVQGSWALGMGDRYDAKKLEPMEVGTYGFAPKGIGHFALSSTETIIQVHGIGPFETRWITPVYEMTDQGVVLEKSPEEPGSAVSTSPSGCFVLKLGAHVQNAREGEGVIVAARCTPGELTQYRIKKANGECFWARGQELRTL